eukprot:scaffold59156_cov50-Phaeocystis_antarctica.AAC.3
MSSSASPARANRGFFKACAGNLCMCVCISSQFCDRLGLKAHGVGLQSIGATRPPRIPSSAAGASKAPTASFCTRWRTLRDVQIHPASLGGRSAVGGVG